MNTAEGPGVQANSRLGDFFRKYLIFFIFIGLVAVIGIVTEGTSLRPQNLTNVIRQVSVIAILGIGLTFVIISTGIDLSVGSILALAAVVSASLAQDQSAVNLMYPGLDLPVFIAIGAGLAVGAAAGLVNGTLVAYFRLAPFVVTLGMLSVARGLTLIYSGGRPISRLKEDYNYWGQGIIAEVPLPDDNVLQISTMVVIMAGLAVAAHILLTRREFGRHLMALGNNLEAVRVAGISIKRILILIYVMSGVLAAVGGILLAGRIGSGNPTLGTGIELDAIAAVVIGGTSLAGGVGTIWGTIVGAMIIGVLQNGLVLLDVSTFWQMVVIGAIIWIALLIDARKNRSTF